MKVISGQQVRRILAAGLTAAFFTGAASVGGASPLDVDIAPNGGLAVRSGGVVLMEQTPIALLNAAGTGIVALPQATRMARAEAEGGISDTWSSDSSVLRREVTPTPGGVRIIWHMKFLNGLVEGRRLVMPLVFGPLAKLPTTPEGWVSRCVVELPAGRVELNFTGPSLPAAVWQSGTLTLAWPYTPAKVNIVRFAVDLLWHSSTAASGEGAAGAAPER